MERFLYSLGIRDVGRVTAETLARHFGNLEALSEAGDERLREVPDVGEVVSERLRDFFSNQDNLDMIEAIRGDGVEWTETDAPAAAPERRRAVTWKNTRADRHS